MKKLTKTFALILAMVFAFAPALHAANVTYTYHNGNTEVRITHNGLSEEKLFQLAQLLATGETINDMQTYGLMCTLFGHKLVKTGNEVITHMVFDTYPRCERKLYNTTLCERNNCNYAEVELISTEKVGCCVE